MYATVEGEARDMLHKGDRRLYGHDMGKARILFAAVAGVGNGVVSQQLHLLGNDLHFMAQEFLANGFHFPAAFAADQLVFRQFQKDFFFRETVQHLGLAALLLPLMLGNQNGIRGRLLRFGGLLLFRLIEKAGLVVQNIAVFLTGLTETGPLGIGENLVHVLQLPLQLVNFRFLLCDDIFQCSYFRSGVCTFLSAAAITHAPEK